ncbi:MAG: helicase C-terminal domain-containing protein [bacterium]
MNPLNEKEIIALDFETTGLDPNYDAIIEVGAFLYIDGEIAGSFDMLVNPGTSIPYNIQRLTNIDESMVEDAIDEKTALERLGEFIGDRPILGQNVSFDTGFLKTRSAKHGLPIWSGKEIDTKPIANLLYPRLKGYGLSNLAQLFKISMDAPHRAGCDAMTTFEVAKRLWQKLLSLDKPFLDSLYQISRASGDMGLINWLSPAIKSPQSAKLPPPEIDETMISRFDNVIGNPSEPSDCTMTENDVLGFLGPESPLLDIIDGYAVRDVQIEMAQAVWDSLECDLSLVAEAGTGTGKSFAYLLPSIVFASKKGVKVVVSTKTKNLQEQLFFKDLPSLRRALNFDFRSVLLKGRGNYLCLQRFFRLVADHSSLRYDERVMLARLLAWAAETESGDVAEANSFYLRHFLSLWAKVRSESPTCLGNRCPYRKKCFVQKARSAVVDAQIVVVNHSLLFAEMADSSVLGEYEHIVIDEAHDLEEVAAEHFGDRITSWNFSIPLSELLRDSVATKGHLPELLAHFTSNYEVPDDFATTYDFVVSGVETLRRIADALFTDITNKLDLIYRWREAPYSLHQRFHAGEDVYIATKNSVKRLIDATARFCADLGMLITGLPTDEDDEIDRLSREITGQMTKLAEAGEALKFMLEPTNPDAVYWWESPMRHDSIDSVMCWAPLDVAERLFDALHTQKRSCVFTSATMSVEHDFQYIKHRLGLDLVEAERVFDIQLGSPYDFQSQLLVLYPEFIPDPNDKRYIPLLSDLIAKISTETRAGSLALFTSYKMLKEAYSYLSPTLADEGILVLAQGISGGRSQLTQQFIADKESVLLGTESFWQGVDVRGEALQLLFLTKLPFSVPTDPYFSAQCERIQRGGGDSFREYAVPRAVIKFRQGIGRLIRGEEDVGVLILCDKRIGTKFYGQAFTNSLPVDFERVYSPSELIEKISRFI